MLCCGIYDNDLSMIDNEWGMSEYPLVPGQRGDREDHHGPGVWPQPWPSGSACDVTAFTSTESKRPGALGFGAHRTLDSRDPDAIEAAAGSFDSIISTVTVKLDWNLYVGALKPRGWLHLVGATREPLDLGVFPLIMG